MKRPCVSRDHLVTRSSFNMWIQRLESLSVRYCSSLHTASSTAFKGQGTACVGVFVRSLGGSPKRLWHLCDAHLRHADAASVRKAGSPRGRGPSVALQRLTGGVRRFQLHRLTQAAVDDPADPASQDSVACKSGAHSPDGRLETGPSLQKRITVCGVVAAAAAPLKSLIKRVRIVSTSQADGVDSVER